MAVGRAKMQRETGNGYDAAVIYFQVPGLGCRFGCGHRAQVQDPGPVPEPEHLNLVPDG